MHPLIYPLFILTFLMMTGENLHAQATENLTTLDPAYHDLDHLIAQGLIRDTIYSHRPWSMKEVARIIHTASQKYQEGAKGDALTEEVLSRLQKRFHKDLIRTGYLDLIPARTLAFELTALDGPFRTVLQNNGIQTIAARTNPLTEYTGGKDYIDGLQYAYETTHEAFLTRYFYLFAQSRFQVEFPKDNAADDVDAFMRKLYLKGVYKNFEFEIGRDEILWGVLPEGGFLISNNTRPVDMLKLTSSAPFRLPWIFKHLGANKYTFFIANLGPDSTLPYTFLNGFKISFKPHPIMEISIAHTMLLGGDGAPALSWHSPITEFFFVRSGGVRGEGANLVDHRMGGDLQVRIPPLKNITVFVEAAWDDLGRDTVTANVTDLMSFVAGLKTPYLPEIWGMALQASFERTAPLMYGHGIWTTGYTLNQNILGLPPGADSRTLTFHAIKHLAPYTLQATVKHINRGSDIYTQTTSPVGGPDEVVKTLDQTNENSILFKLKAERDFKKKFHMALQAGYERVLHADFDPAQSLDNFLGEATLTYKF